MNKEATQLTKKQDKVFKIIEGYFTRYHISPTITELKEALKVKSLRTVTQYLEALEKKGLIYRKTNQKRGIALANVGRTKEHDTVILPVVASAGCDNASVFADERVDGYITVASSFIPEHLPINKFVAIKAVGNSMQEAGIDNGDYVIVEKIEAGQAGENERVVAVLEDNIVIKKLHKTKTALILKPESKNKNYQPIIMKEDFPIPGRVRAVIKMKPEVEELFYDYDSVKNNT